MKSRYFASLAALAAVLLSFFTTASNAQTITTLMSQNFSSSTFPPAGWTASSVGQNLSQGGWYWSSGGNGGSNGSAVASDFYAEQTACYGGTYGTITLTTPSVTVSGLASDSQYVDFDLWFPYNYYEYYYSPYQEVCIVVKDGSKSLLTLTSLANNNWSDINYAYNDPASYEASSYWTHYHVALPGGLTSQSVTFEVAPYYNGTVGGSYCYIGDMYVDNIAFDNVTITNAHYNVLTLTGPALINFGTVPAFQTAGPYYTDVANNSSVPISLTGYTITGANPGDFTVTRFPGTIPVGGKDSIGITYTPQNGGARSATLNVNTTADIPKTFQVSLQGVGLVPNVVYSTNTLFLGNETELDSTSGVQFLYVNNTGGAPLLVTSTSLIGIDNSRAYTVTHVPPGYIQPGGVDSIGVKFHPDIEGIPDAHLVIKTNTANNPSDTVLLDGIGILPHLMLSPQNPRAQISNMNHLLVVNFDSVQMGTDSCMSVTISNPGSDTLAILKNYLASRDFDFSYTPLTAPDTLIPPGGTQTLQVCVTPIQQGFRTATVELMTNIPLTETTPQGDTSKFAIQFNATGVPTGQLMITGPTNGSLAVGKNGCVTDTFWNTGEANLTVTGATVSGTNATVFDGTYGTFPLLVPANSKVLFTICATPTDTGTQTGILTATGTSGNSALNATSNLSVYGTMVNDSIIVTQPFGTLTCEGTTDTATITVMNTGNVSAAYTASTAGTNGTDFTIVPPATSGMLTNGGTATYKVVFNPSTAGAESAQFLATGGPATPVTLNATGGAATIAGSQTVMGMAGTIDTFTVQVNNTGTCAWTPGAATVAAPYSYISGGATAIAPAGSSMLTFAFAPQTTGTFPQTVTFATPTGVASSVSVTINGTAAADYVQPISSANGYSLGQSYPNPNNGTSDITITLPASGNVMLTVVDLQGNTVQNVLNQQYDAGSYNVKLDASALPSGTYYYQMTAGGQTLTRQMTVVK